MDETRKEIVGFLNEIEIRLATGNLENFNLCTLRPTIKVLKTLDVICNSIILHDYDKILNLNLSDLGMRRLLDTEIGEEGRLPCAFIEDEEEDVPLLLYTRQLVLTFVGVSALQKFVKENSSGPVSNGIQEDFNLCTSVLGDISCEEFLSKDGEFPPDNILHKSLLCISRLFLWAAAEIQGGSLTCGWWCIRHLNVHQRLLPDRIVRLHDEAVSLIGKTVEMEWMKDEAHLLPKLLFNVEAAQLHLHYHEVSMARQYISSAQKLVGLGIELDGAYGKRTQFQQKPVAQLVVKLHRGKFQGSLPTDDCCVPNDLLLGDDTLLDKVSFLDSEENGMQALGPEEQIVLLSYCFLVRRSGAVDPLLQEEVTSYVSCLLEQPKVWSIYMTALILRCKLEKESSRRVERALMQLESVINAIRKDDPPFSKRALLFYAVGFPMTWTLEKELADIQLSIGATKSALGLYEKLHLWQDMVICLQRLGRTAQAEAVVREQLQRRETPLLWCLLGDILDDPDMYLKAYELSNGSNARSQRSLGYHYYKRKEWAKCLIYFGRSLEINHLQCGVWFSLGYAALQEKDYVLAAKAYRQVVMLDPDNFEAWNNLSNAYIRTQQKERAWRSLQEALKCNYEEWRVWENFLLVSVDVGAFDEVIRAWHRLLDIRGKYVDSQVLRILVRAINEDLPDMSGQPSSRLRRHALKLLGRLSSMIPNDCCIWESYSALQCPDAVASKDLELLEKAILNQQKAVRHCTGLGNLVSHKKVLEITQRFVELSSTLVKTLNGEDVRRNRQKSATRLTVQSVVTRVKNALVDVVNEERDELTRQLNQLELSLDELQNL